LKKYNFFKNSKYAFEGLITLLKEKAFLIEIIITLPLIFWLLFFSELNTLKKSIMIISIFIIYIAEALNTAVEYTVDLVTDEWREFAKKAKDTASAAVLFSITQAVTVWTLNIFF